MSAAKRNRERSWRVRWPTMAAGAVVAAFLVCTNIYVHQPYKWRAAQADKMPQWIAQQIEHWGNVTANITDAMGVTGFDAVEAFDGKGDSRSFRGVGLPKGGALGDVTLLKRKGYVAAYSRSLRRPLWVAYAAFPYKEALADPEQRPGSFRIDKEVSDSPRSSDYKRSGYDRGHMAPNMAIAVRHGRAAQAETFLLSNICPQRPGLNRGPWFEMEYRISEEWPERYSTVWTVVGAIPGEGRKLKGVIDIPKAFYQVALACGKDGKLRVLAVYMPQWARRASYARSYLISVSELEKLAGVRFFPDLPAPIREKLWSKTPNRLWPSGFFSVFRILKRRYF